MSDTHYRGFLVDRDRRLQAHQAINEAPDGSEIIIQEPKRSSEANARMWVCLHQMAQKCLWHGIKLTDDEWKNLASSGVRGLKVVPNIDGTGFVALGKSTSSMSGRMIGEIVDTLCAIAGQQGVQIVFIEDIEPMGRTA